MWKTCRPVTKGSGFAFVCITAMEAEARDMAQAAQLAFRHAHNKCKCDARKVDPLET